MKDWRIYSVFFLILVAGLGITARVFYIQIVKNGYYSALAKGQQNDYENSTLPRGNIFFQDEFADPAAASGQTGLFLAATNKDWPMVYAVPREIEDAEFVAKSLASILYEAENEEAGAKRLYERLSDKDDPYEPIARQVSKEKVDEIEALALIGVYIGSEKLRYYPAQSLASHVLGFVGYSGNERVGQYGVEGFYDDALSGESKTRDIILSLDYNIQFMAERILREAKNNLEAEEASIIIINPKNGEIIALASTNSFNPNNYSEVESIDVFLNSSIQKLFEPGSIFKPFTVSVALNEGVVTPTSEYKDEGYRTFGKYTIRNSNNEKHGIQNMTNVLELSINTGVVFMEEKIGHDTFRDYMRSFGFDSKSGVDLQGEVLGNFNNIFNTSRDINFATASFGQGIAMTPMQLISAFSAFANGGKMVRPHIVIGEGEIVGEPVSVKTAAQITAMLVSVVENGYGKKAGVPGYKVAGKTGTAQVPKKNGRGYEEEKTIHAFIGYAPAYDPKFLALIRVDDPKGINFSADSVAPLFSKIAEYILNYYEIPPE